MTRKTAETSVQQAPQEDHWLAQWICSIFVILFLLALGLSPRFAGNQCTSDQGMCTPGQCTCPFPLMKRDLVTQDAQACSQCVEEFCPAVAEGDSACSPNVCECEDAAWPRIDIGSPEKPCWQCVHPPKDVTLRDRDESACLRLRGAETSCTVFRYTGAVMREKSTNNSCLVWNDQWQLVACQGTESSMKFSQRGAKDEASKDVFCTGRGKQCLHVTEYMCTTDPSQCSTEQCRCEEPTHQRKEMQTVNRSTCYVCLAPAPAECPVSPSCSKEACECKPGFVKARSASDASCFSCQPEQAAGGLSLLGFLSAGATFLFCVGLGVIVGCAIRPFIVGDPAPRRRRGQPRTWSERCALYLEEAIQVVTERMDSWKPLKRANWLVRKVVSLLDACDAALDPVYMVLEGAFDKVQHAVSSSFQSIQGMMGSKVEVLEPIQKKKREPREARVPRRKEDEPLPYDPINMNVNNEEWMNYVVPSLSAQRQSARFARKDPATHTTAVQRLRQRREAKAQAAELAPATTAEAEVDESWIDQMEEKEAKEKEAREKAAALRRERKLAAKARRAKVSAGTHEVEEEEPVVEKESSPTGQGSEEADLLFSEAIHGMFLLATSDARCEVEEKGQEADSDSEILPEVEPTESTQEDGWTKSASRYRGKRRGPERTMSSESGQVPSEQKEPAAEPDPQQDPEDAEPSAPEEQEAKEVLSKRQRQRLRQRKDPKEKELKDLKELKDPKDLKVKEKPPEVAAKEAKEVPKDAPEASKSEEKVQAVKAELEEPEEAESKDVEEKPRAEGEDAEGQESKALVRNFADVVAGRPARTAEEVEAEEAKLLSLLQAKSFKADAPEFVPMSMASFAMPASSCAMSAMDVMPLKKGRRGRRGRKEEDCQALPLTTVAISDINYDAQSLRLQLDSWGLAYSFFYMPSERQEEYGMCAVVNFVDAGFVPMCQMLFEQSGEGNVSFFPIQGLQNNVKYWTSMGVAEDMVNGPLVFPAAAAQWSADPAMCGKFSPQIKEQFHKTKLCVFNKKQQCSMGAQCPFAHSEEELQQAPDLTKTKLCYNFFRGKCNHSNCKFAHGYGELRATGSVFKTELCRWWANGSCKAGSSCRYAHGVEELRSTPNFSGMFGADFELTEEQQMDFAFAFYPYEVEEMQLSNLEMQREPQREPSASDGEVSEALTASGGGSEGYKLQRQQTAPPTVAISRDDDVILRIKGTFMEAVRIDEEPLSVSMKRSWSDGDLAQLCEAIDSDSD